MKQKLKTHQGASKRFFITGSGKIMCKRAGKRHLLSHKSAKRKRNMGTGLSLKKGDGLSIKRLLPKGN